MLNVERQGTRVVLRVSLAVGEFPFSFDANSEWAARLLIAAIASRLGAVMAEARADDYQRGWKDAKSKRAKAKWFSERLP